MKFTSRVALIFALLTTAGMSHAFRILVDIDGVIGDFEKQAIKKYQEAYPNEPLLPKEDRAEVDIAEAYKRISAQHEKYMKDVLVKEEFCKTIPLMADAKKALEAMKKQGHSIFLAASPLTENASCAAERYEWVKENLGDEWVPSLVLTEDKTIIKADLLIDDEPTIEGDEDAPSWTHILFDQPYNKGDQKPRITKWKEWETVVKENLPAENP